jgi:hypothetical protein
MKNALAFASNSNFVIRICFEFRISNFEFLSPLRHLRAACRV